MKWLHGFLLALLVPAGALALGVGAMNAREGKRQSNAEITLVSQAAIPEGLLPQEELPGGEGGAPAENPGQDPFMALMETTPAPSEVAAGDWRGAGIGDTPLSDVIRAHWVALSPEGVLRGRINTIAGSSGGSTPSLGLRVVFIRDGAVVPGGQAQTDQSGIFEARIAPGIYTLIAGGNNGFIAYSVMVLPPPRASGAVETAPGNVIAPASYQDVEDVLEINSLAVPPTFITLKRLIREQYYSMRPSQVASGSYDLPLELAAPGGSQDSRAGFDEIASRDIPSTYSTAVHSHQVMLTADGRMVGRLHGVDTATGRPKMVEQTNVFVIQNDVEVARTTVDRFGVFTVRDLRPGSYSLVAAGRDGFGAVGFELVQSDVNVQVDRGTIQYVSTLGGAVAREERQTFCMTLIGHRDLRMGLFAAGRLGPPGGMPMGGGGGGGFGGGSGGGGGGGGGAGGGWAGLAGLAALAALLASDSDDDIFFASPFQPPLNFNSFQPSFPSQPSGSDLFDSLNIF